MGEERTDIVLKERRKIEKRRKQKERGINDGRGKKNRYTILKERKGRKS